MLPAGFVAGFRSESALERTVYSVCYIFVVLTPRYTKYSYIMFTAWAGSAVTAVTAVTVPAPGLEEAQVQLVVEMQRTLNVVGQPGFEALVIPIPVTSCHILGICGVLGFTGTPWMRFLHGVHNLCVLRHQGLVPVLSSVAWVPRQGRIGLRNPDPDSFWFGGIRFWDVFIY